MAETLGKSCGGNGAEHTENVHQINIVDIIGREIERLFDEVEAHVIVEADKYPQNQSAGEVERYQVFGHNQMDIVGNQ